MFKKMITGITVLLLALSLSTSVLAATYQVDSQIKDAPIYGSTMYVPMRAFSRQLDSSCTVSWSGGTAIVKSGSMTVTARPGDCYIQANGRALYVESGVKLVNGTTYVPVRVLAKAFDCAVTWNAAAKSAAITRGSGAITPAGSSYNADSLYWLSRIIHAESQGEPLLGKVAVGNVILNRVKSSQFPNSIYDVIFDKTDGTQFQPTANGSIYNTPNEDSVIAAKLCLEGVNVAEGCLYFLNPSIATSTWIQSNCTFIKAIGNHHFYA